MNKLFEYFTEDKQIAELDGYTLFKEEAGKRGFIYLVYDKKYNLVSTWRTYEDIEKASNIKNSAVYRRFEEEVELDKDLSSSYTYDDEYDEDELVGFEKDDNQDVKVYDDGTVEVTNKKPSSNYWLNNYLQKPIGGYYYEEPKKSTGFLDKLNNSDTLVIHCDDRSTDMLCQIYQGKNWDVLRDGNIDKEELHDLLKSHDRIICLGHGTGYGLINKQGWGGMTIGESEAPFLKDKKLFIIWCNADEYFKRHGIGQGQFITGNMPSEVWECAAAGCGQISSKLMLDNITYWSKLCADVVEDCLNGNVQKSVDYIRKNYLEKYGNHPVTIYNCLKTQALGVKQPLPKFEFKGEPLTEKDYPYKDYNEEEFLKKVNESF